MNDIHTHTIRECLQSLSDNLLSANHDVSVALEARTNNEAIGSIIHLRNRLDLAVDLCNAVITVSRLTDSDRAP